MFALLVRCFAGGNDADGVVFDFDMHHKEQTTLLVVTDHGLSHFIVATGVDQAEERIEKYRRCLFKADSAVIDGVGGGLLRVPDEGGSVELEVNVHMFILTCVLAKSIHLTYRTTSSNSCAPTGFWHGNCRH